MAEQELLTRTLVELADNLTEDFDVIDLMTLLTGCCCEAFEVADAGIVLAAPTNGDLRVMASSSATMRDLELYELQSSEEPCLDCYRNEQLNHALNSRVIIEQAKGMLAERSGIDVDEAFVRLRGNARSQNRRLGEIAQEVLDGNLASADPSPLESSRD